MKVTSEQLSQCAEKIASYGFTDRVDGHSIQALVAHAANELSKERLIVKSLTKKLEDSLAAMKLRPTSEMSPELFVVGKKLLVWNGCFFEVEWDGEHWCSIGGYDFDFWMELPKIES